VSEEAFLKHIKQKLVVGLLFKLKLTAILHVFLEFWRKTLA
jgi:hypothetical protein